MFVHDYGSLVRGSSRTCSSKLARQERLCLSSVPLCNWEGPCSGAWTSLQDYLCPPVSEDPARYRKPHEVERHQYFSVFRTKEWKQFQERFGIQMFHFDQHPMGHKKRKPTTLATNMQELGQLDGLRGEPENEARSLESFRAMTLAERMQESKTWSTWAPGLKAAIATALNHHMRQSDEVPMPSSRPAMKVISQVALEGWKQHYLNDHLPARRDCQHCVRAQGRSRPHRRVTHPAAFTLSIDLSGRMSAGVDQENERCKYLMIGCYTFPVTGKGYPLIDPPDRQGSPDEDHPLPPMDFRGDGDEVLDPAQDGHHPLPPMDLWGGAEAVHFGQQGGHEDEVLAEMSVMIHRHNLKARQSFLSLTILFMKKLSYHLVLMDLQKRHPEELMQCGIDWWKTQPMWESEI